MKKIILILVICIAIMSCSSNDSNDNSTPQELIGSWKVVGYFDDIEDPETGSNYHLVENGPITKYNVDGSFGQIYNSSESYNGIYTVSSDSTLTMDFTTTASGEPYTFVSKIKVLNDLILELGGDGPYVGNTRFEKVNQ